MRYLRQANKWNCEVLFDPKNIYNYLLKDRELILTLEKPINQSWQKYIYNINNNVLNMTCYNEKGVKRYSSQVSIKTIKNMNKTLYRGIENTLINYSFRNSLYSYPDAMRTKKKIEKRTEPISRKEVN